MGSKSHIYYGLVVQTTPRGWEKQVQLKTTLFKKQIQGQVLGNQPLPPLSPTPSIGLFGVVWEGEPQPRRPEKRRQGTSSLSVARRRKGWAGFLPCVIGWAFASHRPAS